MAPATPLERDPSPPRIIIDDGQSDEANARQESSSEDERPPTGAQGLDAPPTDLVTTPTFRQVHPPPLRDVMARDPNVGTWHKDEIGHGDTSSQAQRNGPQSPAVKEKPGLRGVESGNVQNTMLDCVFGLSGI